MRRWFIWLAIDALISSCADPKPPPAPPAQAARRPLHDAVASRTTRIERELAWAFGEQPAQAGPLLEGYAPGGAIAGSDELVGRLMKPRADGSVDLTLAFVPSGDRISVITLTANDARACEAVTKRVQQKWPAYVSFLSDRLWLVWSQDDGTRAAWSATSKGCELRFEPWQPKVADWFEQADGAIELSLLDIVAARTRLGERVTGAKLEWSDPGLGIGVGATTCEAIDDGGTRVTCRGASSTRTIDDMVAWLDKTFGAHAGPAVAASTPSAAFDTGDSTLTWNPTGPSLAVKLHRTATTWELELRHVTPLADPTRAAACARAARAYDDGYSRSTAQQRMAIVQDLCTSTPWPRTTLACFSAKSATVDKCEQQMTPALRHLLDTRLFVTR
ncbi:MAG TPA: hypothetical protein VGM90_36330 [Kofleriaceae bacterium]|jgi:hypothetical protein